MTTPVKLLTAAAFGVMTASADTIGNLGELAAKAAGTVASHSLQKMVASPLPVTVPEPGAFVVLGLGVALAAGLRRRSRGKATV